MTRNNGLLPTCSFDNTSLSDQFTSQWPFPFSTLTVNSTSRLLSLLKNPLVTQLAAAYRHRHPAPEVVHALWASVILLPRMFLHPVGKWGRDGTEELGLLFEHSTAASGGTCAKPSVGALSFVRVPMSL